MILIKELSCKDDFTSSLFIQVFFSFTFASAAKIFYAALIFDFF